MQLAQGAAQVRAEFVGLESPTGYGREGWGGHPCQGIYYAPVGATPKVAFIATHYNLDFTEHYLAPFMAERGFGFLGWNTRFRGAEALFLVDHAVAEIGAGVRWLHEVAHVDTVVLLGNSGGASLMATYQGHAEHQTLQPGAGGRLCRGLDDLLPGDLYISTAAHPGRADLLAYMMDPSVTDETDPGSRDPSLDMYDERNGPPYSDEFQQRYRAAQLARNRRITAWARAQLRLVTAEGHWPAGLDDLAFVVHGTSADLRFLDPAIDASDRAIGSTLWGRPEIADYLPAGLNRYTTLRSWINQWSIDDTNGNALKWLPELSTPTLVVGGSADTGSPPVVLEQLHDAIGPAKKDYLLIEGATHYFE
ncbi:MAG: hypothetical protein QOK06_1992, partial [Acidimicrobiaceae bacterium]